VLPRDIQDVMARHKDIMYSSRTRYTTDVYRRIHNLKLLLAKALAKIPPDQLSDDDKRRLGELADLPELTILHIIYQQKAYEGHAKDYEFSGTSMREHWQSGYEDTVARSSVRNGWRCRRPAPACSCTTCTASTSRSDA
jgi:NTE family protein